MSQQDIINYLEKVEKATLKQMIEELKINRSSIIHNLNKLRKYDEIDIEFKKGRYGLICIYKIKKENLPTGKK